MKSDIRLVLLCDISVDEATVLTGDKTHSSGEDTFPFLTRLQI